MEPGYLWFFLLIGYPLTVAIETPILMLLLSARHTYGQRLAAGFWLTACSYPIVVLVLPLCIKSPFWYLLIAETFAPLSECMLFCAAFQQGRTLPPGSRMRDYAAIVIANLASFGIGLLLG